MVDKLTNDGQTAISTSSWASVCRMNASTRADPSARERFIFQFPTTNGVRIRTFYLSELGTGDDRFEDDFNRLSHGVGDDAISVSLVGKIFGLLELVIRRIGG